jgi:hypothetical protein
MTHDFTIRVQCESPQPETFILAAVTAAGRGILEGWCENVKVTIVRSAETSDRAS